MTVEQLKKALARITGSGVISQARRQAILAQIYAITARGG